LDDELLDTPKIGFHILWDFHHSVLDPIYDLLKDDFNCLMTKNVENLIQFNPKVLILADRQYHLFRNGLPKTIIVWTRHGFASKNEAGKGVTGCDFACVSSEWVREEFIKRGFIPNLGFWVTGFPAADILFQKSSNLDNNLPKNFLNRKPMLLYVPTYNELLNSVNVLGENWIDKLREILPEINIIIKPHPVIPEKNPEWMDMWRNAANRNERTLLIEDTHSSVYQYLRFADILLSDACSVIFYFLAFNKPIILVNNPNRFKERQFYDEKGPEWTWRDMAVEIDKANELPSAVLRCLKTPEEKSEKRLIYKERVFGRLCDGKSTERLVNQIKILLNPEKKDKEYVDTIWNSFFKSHHNRELETQLIKIKLENQMLKHKIMNYEKSYSLRFAKNLKRIPGVNFLIKHVTRSKKQFE
jgi:hypothetical protein